MKSHLSDKGLPVLFEGQRLESKMVPTNLSGVGIYH